MQTCCLALCYNALVSCNPAGADRPRIRLPLSLRDRSAENLARERKLSGTSRL